MTVHLGCPSGDNKIVDVDCVLYAIGRGPNTSDLGLDIAVSDNSCDRTCMTCFCNLCQLFMTLT